MAVGVNEYLYALSLRGHGAVRSGGRIGDSRWEIRAAAADPPLHVHRIKFHQQYESPAAVVETVRRLWQPTFDAMASPLSAICGAYATLEDDVLSPDLIPRGSTVYANPAYAPAAVKNGIGGIETHLSKLIQVDVAARGCTLVALLPSLPHTAWYEHVVGACHEIFHVRGELVFRNPYTDLVPPKKGYLWQVICDLVRHLRVEAEPRARAAQGGVAYARRGRGR